LPVTVSGKAVDEAHVAWNFVMRDLAFAERADFLLVGGVIAAQLDPGAKLLAVLHVGHAEHLPRLDLRMGVEEFLDLAR